MVKYCKRQGCERNFRIFRRTAYDVIFQIPVGHMPPAGAHICRFFAQTQSVTSSVQIPWEPILKVPSSSPAAYDLMHTERFSGKWHHTSTFGRISLFTRNIVWIFVLCLFFIGIFRLFFRSHLDRCSEIHLKLKNRGIEHIKIFPDWRMNVANNKSILPVL